METESQLVTRAKKGDDAAFDELVRRYLPALFTFLSRYLRDDSAAEDAAQETFVKAWKNLSRFDESRPLAPWLFRIARNAANDMGRRKQALPFSRLLVRGKDQEEMAFEETLADDAPLPAELFEKRELSSMVVDALGQLPERDRALLLFRYEDELPFEQIAEAMDAPVNTVKSWHRRALIQLKKLLERYAP